MATMNLHHVNRIETENRWIAEAGDPQYPNGLLVTRLAIHTGEGSFVITCFGNENAEPIPMERKGTQA